MKINFNDYDLSGLKLREQDGLILIYPEKGKEGIGKKWNKDNLIFRSSIWTKDGELVSASFRKYFNLNEATHVVPDPINLNKATITDKMDGSCLIFSKYKNKLIARTRGTFDARTLANGYEIDLILEQYPHIKLLPEQFSYIFEWYSPENQVIIKYGDKPLIWLTGMISHDDYSMVTQGVLDSFAHRNGFNRPKTHKFKTLEEAVNTCKELKNEEGYCIYFNNDQDIKKVKSLDYLKKHALRFDISLPRTIDLWLVNGEPTYQEFEATLLNTYDFESFEFIRGFASKTCEAGKIMHGILSRIKAHTDTLKDKDRKTAALEINAAYGAIGRSGIAFSYLNGKEVSIETKKKLITSIIK